MVRQVDLLILGAGFYGCGFAAASKREPLLLEEEILPGSDFVLSLNPGREYDAEGLRTEIAREFHARLRAVNAISPDGRLSLAGASEVLAVWCLKRPVELGVKVLAHDGHRVKAITANGLQEYEAARIVDARGGGTEKWLNAMISVPAGLKEGCHPPFELRSSLVKGEGYLSLKIPTKATWQEARQLFYRAWDSRPEPLKGSTLMLLATRFDYRRFANPLAAMDAGALEGGAR